MGSSYDNALAETINGLYKTELIKPRGPWRNGDQVEFATAEWVDWFTGGSFSTAATRHRRRWRLPTTLNTQPTTSPSCQISESPDMPGGFMDGREIPGVDRFDGHFPALEQPRFLTQDIRAFFGALTHS